MNYKIASKHKKIYFLIEPISCLMRKYLIYFYQHYKLGVRRMLSMLPASDSFVEILVSTT